ncbi:septum site-determining protein MinC [Flocculibacter collagenilyticus]|uniref:septum site-determining protein MinC n=1 Tax=Flocculibacter collagenilyticus TaxID=2744479 RepID=UPI0018F409A4|nr:septum site-determining protein MinC [Flocculibacter collagenilyticus]
MSQASFELKGNLFTISVLHMKSYDLDCLKLSLEDKLAQAPNFFYRAPIIINISTLENSTIDFVAIKELVSSTKMVLVGITGGTAAQKQDAKDNGLAVLTYSKDKVVSKPIPSEAKTNTVVEQVVVEKNVFQPAKVVEQSVRSGQQIYAQGTDLIIKGAVSAGAEVIADGNIHIYGTLRGRAIAGAQGDKSARIFCSNIQAELVSISGTYWLSDSLHDQYWKKPVYIQLIDDKLSISDLD